MTENERKMLIAMKSALRFLTATEPTADSLKKGAIAAVATLETAVLMFDSPQQTQGTSSSQFDDREVQR